MAGLGMLMLLLGVLALWLRRGDRLYHSRPFLRFAPVDGAIRPDRYSRRLGDHRGGPPTLGGVWRSAHRRCRFRSWRSAYVGQFIDFIVVYSAVFGVGYSHMLRLIRKGPQEMLPATTGTPARPLSAATEGYLQKESR